MTVITATVAEHYRRAYADPRCPEPVRQLLAQLVPKRGGEVLALKDWHDVHVPVHARGDAPRPPPVLMEGIPPSPADAVQVGGRHYKEVPIQPWAVIDTWPLEQRIGFYRGNLLKYTMRMGTKDASEVDIRKAGHYAQKLADVLASTPKGT